MKTIILCGGKGTRLGPLGERIPKTLLPLGGKPCLQHIVENYVGKGYREFVLCIGHRGEMITDFCKHHFHGASLEWSNAGEEASMLERLHRARNLFEQRAWITYGDTLINADLDNMLLQHNSSGAALSLSTAFVQSPFGLVETDDNEWLMSFREKPEQPFFVGHMLMERSVLDSVDAKLLRAPDGEGLVKLIRDLIQLRQVRTHRYTGPQITFNTREDLNRAEVDMTEFFTQTEDKA